MVRGGLWNNRKKKVTSGNGGWRAWTGERAYVWPGDVEIRWGDREGR